MNQLLAHQTLQSVRDNELPPAVVGKCIRQAFDKLTLADAETVAAEVTNLNARIHNYLGPVGALELISKIGMKLIEKGL